MLGWARAHWSGHVTQAESGKGSRKLIKSLSNWDGMGRAQKLSEKSEAEAGNMDQLVRMQDTGRVMEKLYSVWHGNYASDTKNKSSFAYFPPQKKNLAFCVWNSFLFFSELLLRRRCRHTYPKTVVYSGSWHFTRVTRYIDKPVKGPERRAKWVWKHNKVMWEAIKKSIKLEGDSGDEINLGDCFLGGKCFKYK